MKVMWKAAFAAVLLIAATTIEIGCGDTYRPVATVVPPTNGNPSGNETEAVVSCCLDPSSVNAVTTTPSSVITDIDVSGNTNSGNKVLGNIVGQGMAPVSATASPMAFDGSRSSIYTANTTSDSITQSFLSSSSSGFSVSTNTISLEPGSKPVSVAFQYFGPTYSLDYVANSGTNTATCPGTGSVGVIAEAAAQLKATVCIGTKAAPANPVAVWIFRDQSKAFVLDNSATGSGHVYVLNASKFKVTNSFTVGMHPVKMAQSADGNYIYVLNSGDGTISVIDAVLEQVVATVTVGSSALVDIAQDPNYTDTSANTQYNHIWVLQADGTVSVYDNSTPGTLTPLTSLSTITPALLAKGVYPTNLALLRDGTMAYVGLGNSDQMVAINTSQLAASGLSTANATTLITVGVHRSTGLLPVPYVVTPPCTTPTTGCGTGTPTSYTYYMSETTTPTVMYVAVSRQGNSSSTGNSSDLAKAYALTTTSTTYTYFSDSLGKNAIDPTSIQTWTMPAECSAVAPNGVVCPNLYSGTSVVAAASSGTTLINTFITNIPAPTQVTYCNPTTTLPDAQSACPLMTPTMVLGRS